MARGGSGPEIVKSFQLRKKKSSKSSLSYELIAASNQKKVCRMMVMMMMMMRRRRRRSREVERFGRGGARDGGNKRMIEWAGWLHPSERV